MWLDQGRICEEVRLRGSRGHEHVVHGHARVPGDQTSEFRWSPLVRPVQVQVLWERLVELPEGEALDIRIGNVQADVVDAFVEPKVLERREFHGAAIVTAKIKLWSFVCMLKDKKRDGPRFRAAHTCTGGGGSRGHPAARPRV